jgi:hypothetical protein
VAVLKSNRHAYVSTHERGEVVYPDPFERAPESVQPSWSALYARSDIRRAKPVKLIASCGALGR